MARLRYVQTRREWSLYWCDAQSRFRRYEGIPATSSVQDLLDEIDADPTDIFWG